MKIDLKKEGGEKKNNNKSEKNRELVEKGI